MRQLPTLTKTERLPWKQVNYGLIRRRFAIQQPDSVLAVYELQENIGLQKSRQGGRVSLLGPLTITGVCLFFLYWMPSYINYRKVYRFAGLKWHMRFLEGIRKKCRDGRWNKMTSCSSESRRSVINGARKITEMAVLGKSSIHRV